MKKERLVSFTDAILAIIMTILILDLKEPSSLTLSGLWALRNSYFAYTLSFFWLGTMWVGLHNEWQYVKRISPAVVWCNLFLLFWTSFFPYVTKIVSEHFYNKTAQVMYGIAVILTTLCNLLLSFLIKKENDNKNLNQMIEYHLKWLWIENSGTSYCSYDLSACNDG